MLMCWIPDKNGVPHVALGMQKALFVRGGKPTKVSGAKASITITQIDYQFILSKRIEAGLHTIEVLNHGTQPHELVVVKLAPGATVQDAIASFEPGASGPLRVNWWGELPESKEGSACTLPANSVLADTASSALSLTPLPGDHISFTV